MFSGNLERILEPCKNGDEDTSKTNFRWKTVEERRFDSQRKKEGEKSAEAKVYSQKVSIMRATPAYVNSFPRGTV